MCVCVCVCVCVFCGNILLHLIKLEKLIQTVVLISLSVRPVCCMVICMFMQHHNDTIIKTHEGRKTQVDFFTNIFNLSLYCKGSKGLFKGLRVRRSWRPNINCNILTPLLWPSRCVFLVLLMLGSTPSGFPMAPSVGCGFPYHIWSLAVWNSTGNCFLDSNSTELNNNSTPTRSPTGSLKSNV